MKRDILNASKWAMITELLSKVSAPIVNMLLARLLAPDAFGVVATLTMVISFAEIFADAGFQKYLIQRDFSDEKELESSMNTAFWTNMGISCLLWGAIILFKDPLASSVGSPGLGMALAVAGSSIPLVGLSSIQMACFHRNLDLKSAFYGKVIGISIPFLVTIPLAFLTKSYWALLVGTICTNIANAVFLTIRSPWKPKLCYNITAVKKMISFSMWAMTERILGWANLNVGIFIVGTFLSSHYLGLYKVSMSTVNQLISIFTNSLRPVLLSVLSQDKNNKEAYTGNYYQFCKSTGILAIPMCIGVFVYREFVTELLLGRQWQEASDFLGLWALVKGMSIATNFFAQETYIALGKPQLAVLSQTIQLVILTTVLSICAPLGYEYLYRARVAVALAAIAVAAIMLRSAAKISVIHIVKISLPSYISAVLMALLGVLMQKVSSGLLWNFASIMICAVSYFAVLALFPDYRQIIKKTVAKALKR